MDTIRVFNRTFTLEQMQRGVVLACVGLCAFMLYKNCWPEFGVFLQKRSDNKDKRQEILVMQAETRNREQLRMDLAQMHTNLATMRARFPNKSEILSTLIVDLSDFFRQNECELLTFSPGEPTPISGGTSGEITKDLQTIPIGITARGSYSNLISLFKRLSKYERVVDMQGLALAPISGSKSFSNKLSVQFTLTTYVLGQ